MSTLVVSIIIDVWNAPWRSGIFEIQMSHQFQLMNMMGEMFYLDQTYYVSGLNLSQILPGQPLRRVNTGSLYGDVSPEIAE